jgi:hypothetical protein
MFSMRAADGGALLRSASVDMSLQRRRCRIKDWRYLQAAEVFFFGINAAACCVFRGCKDEGYDVFCMGVEL